MATDNTKLRDVFIVYANADLKRAALHIVNAMDLRYKPKENNLPLLLVERCIAEEFDTILGDELAIENCTRASHDQFPEEINFVKFRTCVNIYDYFETHETTSYLFSIWVVSPTEAQHIWHNIEGFYFYVNCSREGPPDSNFYIQKFMEITACGPQRIISIAK